MNSTTSKAEILKDAAWHLYALNPASQASQWLHLSEEEFRAASFLDQRLLAFITQAAPESRTLPLSNLQGWINDQPDPQSQPSAHFIFHIGHCGSTLISRALAASPAVLPLREPLTLRQLAAIQPNQYDERWSQQLQLALAAHSRVFHPGQVSMIKATSTCNALIKPLMELAPQAKSLLLYLPLESYLAGMLGKLTPALDLPGHAAARLEEWQIMTGKSLQLDEAKEFTEAQLAVLAWMTSMTRLLQARDQYPDRCLLLDFEIFLAEPVSNLERLIKFFDLIESSTEVLAAWPNISVGYSKQPDQPYSAFNRSKTLMRGRTQRAADIQAGLDWSKDLIRQYPAFQACEGFL